VNIVFISVRGRSTITCLTRRVSIISTSFEEINNGGENRREKKAIRGYERV
jgi:hypothetical protein